MFLTYSEFSVFALMIELTRRRSNILGGSQIIEVSLGE
jgi:hypothetical protein